MLVNQFEPALQEDVVHLFLLIGAQRQLLRDFRIVPPLAPRTHAEGALHRRTVRRHRSSVHATRTHAASHIRCLQRWERRQWGRLSFQFLRHQRQSAQQQCCGSRTMNGIPLQCLLHRVPSPLGKFNNRAYYDQLLPCCCAACRAHGSAARGTPRQRFHCLRHHLRDILIYLVKQRIVACQLLLFLLLLLLVHLGFNRGTVCLPPRQSDAEDHQESHADRRPHADHAALVSRRCVLRLPPLLHQRGLLLAPLPRRRSKPAERILEGPGLRLAFDARANVRSLSARSIAHLPPHQCFFAQMSTHPVVHCPSPTCLLTTLSARYRCDFTVFTFIRIASAISGNSSSSTKRSRKMLRCRSLNVSTARHTVATRSWAINRCSVELCVSGSRSLISDASSIAARFQKRSFMLRWWSRTRLTAMRISQVLIAHSPRKLACAVCARKKQSWVSDSATSSSRVANRM